MEYMSTSVLAEVVAVKGDPTQNIEAIREVQFVMKGGKIYKRL
jgi:imidazolonepropionase-like amidohydrolase